MGGAAAEVVGAGPVGWGVSGSWWLQGTSTEAVAWSGSAGSGELSRGVPGKGGDAGFGTDPSSC